MVCETYDDDPGDNIVDFVSLATSGVNPSLPLELETGGEVLAGLSDATVAC